MDNSLLVRDAEAQAFPLSQPYADVWGKLQIRAVPGLTKRELFAAMAMQGLLSGAYSAIADLSQISGMPAVAVAAQTAVEHADALLTALDRTQETSDGR